MKLYCVSEYHNEPRRLHFVPGPIEVAADVAAFLQSDAPENFTQVPAGRKTPAPGIIRDLTAPPSDKMVRSSSRKSA